MTAKLTQCESIYQLLWIRGSRGAFVYEFITPRNMGGLGVAQYNARIKELRDRGENIICDEPGHFMLVRPTTQDKELTSGAVQPALL